LHESGAYLIARLKELFSISLGLFLSYWNAKLCQEHTLVFASSVTNGGEEQ